MLMKTFEKYLIEVGVRFKADYSYNEDDVYNNIEYFRDCYKKGISPYTALLLLPYTEKSPDAK